MNYYHESVLLKETINMLNVKNNGVYIDGTIGGAGHAVEILKMLGRDGTLIGIDKDKDAIEASKNRLSDIESNAKIILRNCSYTMMKDVCFENKIEQVDGIILDIGVSSHQLDLPERGFSYQEDAKLDMRMDQSQKLTAEIIVNEFNEKEIAQILRNYGEEKWASRIAHFIAEQRKRKRITTTFELVNIIKDAIPASQRRTGPHPAKRSFQALRIAVNNELEELKNGINAAVPLLKHKGRLCIITFHSLEDRIVKKEFLRIAGSNSYMATNKNYIVKVESDECSRLPEALIITKKPVIPSEEEKEANPRSKSAKLRVLEKL